MHFLKKRVPKLLKEPVIYFIAAVLIIPAVFFVAATPNDQQSVDSPEDHQQANQQGTGENAPVSQFEESTPKPAPKKVELNDEQNSQADDSTCDEDAKSTATNKYRSSVAKENNKYEDNVFEIKHDLLLRARSLFNQQPIRTELAKEAARHQAVLDQLKQIYESDLEAANC